MEKQIISKRITSILDDITRLQSALYAMNTADIQRYPDNYEVLSTDAALRSETITCRLRHLIYATTSIKKPAYLQSAATMQGIEIKEKNGIIEIIVPSLLPKRKQWKSSEFLTDPIYFALSNYVEKNPFPKFRHCVVYFSHIYNKELPRRRMKDYDNLELKQLLDVISTFIMTDDSGLLCDAYNTTTLGKVDCTCISVMDKDRFSEWLLERQNRLESISDF